MKKKVINFLKYIAFFIIGVLLFLWIYKKYGIDWNELKNANYWWIVLSFLIGVSSHVSRAIRWNMLIKPLGYTPRTINSFLAVLIMYLTNFILPRAGEIVRCSVLARYEKVPFTKLVGTVVVERTTDVIALIVFATIVILSQIGVFNTYFQENPESQEKIAQLFSTSNIMLGLGALLLMLIITIVFRKFLKKTKIYARITQLLKSFLEGLKTISQLENKWIYIGHTLFIYIIWLLAMYVVFFSYEPTKHLTFSAAMATFVMGALGMIAPVQGGIGAYHYMVMSTLVIYGIAEKDGFTFAIIAHAAANIPLMLAGAISFMVLPIINRNKEQSIN